ncbi:MULTISPECIES: hypothetical protein [unclassified Clostridium]|uniref:hypothetical protein n=1 Tax=unclassified Clostridium TaxID=2614128 RepID=UPI001106D33C|nr:MULTISPECIES: hypothetical protein [unclassified Clostridium]
MIKKIHEADLEGLGVIGQPDIPGLSALEMQQKVEEVARSGIIPAYNAMVDDLQSTAEGSGAANVGSAPIAGLAGDTVQEKLQSAMDALNRKVGAEQIKQIRINPLGELEYSYDGQNFFPIAADVMGAAKVPYVVIPLGESIPPEQRVPDTLYFATLAQAGVYGARWAEGSSASAGERVGDAAGLVANAGVDDEVVQNDFDGVYPWAGRRRCNGYRDSDGEFVVTAYEGEAGYSQSDPDKLVYVETPLFYYFDGVKDGYEQKLISMLPQPGFLPSPACVGSDGSLRSHSYSAAYLMALENGKATSRAGAFSAYGGLNGMMDGARTLGAQYALERTATWYTESLLMTVEFATKDLQSVMAGATSYSYNIAKAKAAESGANRVALGNAYNEAAQYVVGVPITLSHTGSTGDVTVENRRVTAITPKNASETYLYFDGEPVDITQETTVFVRSWENGAADGVRATSGSPVSNQSGKYPCVYRGRENPYGNAWQFLCDVMSQRTASAGAWAYNAYYLPDATRYSSGALTEDYVKLDYALSAESGTIAALGCDGRYPWVRLATAVVGDRNSGYADAYAPPDATTYQAVWACGGMWNGADAGPCAHLLNGSTTAGSYYTRARLG